MFGYGLDGQAKEQEGELSIPRKGGGASWCVSIDNVQTTSPEGCEEIRSTMTSVAGEVEAVRPIPQASNGPITEVDTDDLGLKWVPSRWRLE